MSKISKLGLGIVAFEGTEHLKNITYELRDLCDTIAVCLQQTSYHGEPIKEEDIKVVENLKNLGYIDTIIWFEPTDFHKDKPEGDAPRIIETDKRNFICDYLEKECGCSHIMVIDSDEFYHHDDFQRAKENYSNDDNMHIAYCEYTNYYRDYRHLMVWPFRSYVPFIAEAKYRFDFEKGNFTQPSDPTRRYYIDPNAKMNYFNIFDWSIVKMHHLSWIRLKIETKINAWSSKKLFSNYETLKQDILDRYYNYQDGLNAILMFNVPYNQVKVNKLPKQYIHPHFRLDEEPVMPYLQEKSKIDRLNKQIVD